MAFVWVVLHGWSKSLPMTDSSSIIATERSLVYCICDFMGSLEERLNNQAGSSKWLSFCVIIRSDIEEKTSLALPLVVLKHLQSKT